jgi:hypothetical protein
MRQKFLFRHWLLLISVSLLVQIYIACAVIAIFIFDLTGRIYKKELNYRSAFSSLAVTFLLSLLIMYISGYFTYTVKEILNTDFWGTNIFSLRIGLAPTVLLVLMIGFIIKDKKIFKEPIKSIPIFLVTGCILLYIFSWGPNWQLAGHTVLTLPHIPLYTIFRNMHRFALPLTYLVIFFIFLTFSKKVGDKNKIIIPLLIGLIVLQFYDHRNNYFKTKQVLKATDQYLTDFGTYSAEILKKDSLICTGEMTKSAVDAVYLFALSGKPSRCAFISRINAFEPINIEYFANNRYNKNSVYLINSNPANQSVWSYLEANFSEAEVVEVNGLHFFLPEK